MALAGQPSPSSSSHNFTVLVAEVTDDGYDTLVADIWVGVVLTLMVLSCVCCVCSCLLYHKFQQWKRSVLAARGPPGGEATEGPYADVESLPSYTIVSGLPSYEEALTQLRLARERRASLKSASDLAAPPPASPTGPAAPASPLAAAPAVAIPVPITAPALAVANPAAAPSAIKLSVAEFFQVYKTYPPM